MFSSISSKINESYEVHEENIKKHCVKTSIIALSDFYAQFEREVREINSEITPSKDSPSIGNFVAMFKALDEYPAILQKPRKALGKEMQRGNSFSRDHSLASSLKESTLVIQDVIKLEAAPLAKETYAKFKRFQQVTAQLLDELQEINNKAISTYAEILCQLGAFVKQLEKLLPSASECNRLFCDNEQKLQSMRRNLEELNFICNNQELFHDVGQAMNSARMESLAEMITYLLSSLAMY